MSPSCPPKRDVKVEEGEGKGEREGRGRRLFEESPNHEYGKDRWKQLTMFYIPVLSGNELSCGCWKAAFMACVDNAPETGE